MSDDIGAYRKVAALPSPGLFNRMKQEQDRANTRAFEEAVRRALIEIEDALFDEAVDRQIKEIAA